MSTEDKSSLVGKFFHSFDKDGYVDWQGYITKKVTNERYLIMLYSWLTGFPTKEKMVDVKDMSNWEFYDNGDDWKYNGDLYGKISEEKGRKSK